MLFLRSCSGFSCGDSNPLRDVFTVQHPTEVTMVTATDLSTVDQKGKLEWCNGEVTLIYSEEAGTQIIQHQDSLTDYCSISSNCSLEQKESGTAPTLDVHLLNSIPLSVNEEESGSDQDQQASANPMCDLDCTERTSPTSPQLQAFALLPVSGTLWIPRYKMAHT